MTYSDKVRAEVAARYGVPVRCQVQIIPPGVIVTQLDCVATHSKVELVRKRRGKSRGRAPARQQLAEMRDGGASFRQLAHRVSRNLRHGL